MHKTPISTAVSTTPRSFRRRTVWIALVTSVVLLACAGPGGMRLGTLRSCNSAECRGPVSLASAYRQAHWGSNVSVTFPDECTMTLTSNGLPNHALPAKYLMPRSGKDVANAPLSGMALGLADTPTEPNYSTVSYNVCPRLTTPVPSNMGGIGMMISGSILFNGSEGNGMPAMSDNVNYTYQDANGKPQIAAFLDTCSGHFTPGGLPGRVYHYHANPPCVTSQVDIQGGPSHLIGIALDGFPIYGGRDMQGKVITLAQLDACNGIDSPTPEFPNGVYHYVLPEGVKSLRASIACYSGAVSKRLLAQAQAAGTCKSPAAAPVVDLAGKPSERKSGQDVRS
jgi:hypothetical protein